jgi:hypothetical protein
LLQTKSAFRPQISRFFAISQKMTICFKATETPATFNEIGPEGQAKDG